MIGGHVHPTWPKAGFWGSSLDQVLGSDEKESIHLAASKSLSSPGPERCLDFCGCIFELLAKFFGGKQKGKERREERLLSEYKGEKSEQFNSFSKKTGRVKVGLDRDPNTLEHRPKFLSQPMLLLRV